MPTQFSKRRSVSMTADTYFAAQYQAKANGMALTKYVEYCIRRNLTEEARQHGHDAGIEFREQVERRRRKIHARETLQKRGEENPPEEAGNTVFL